MSGTFRKTANVASKVVQSSLSLGAVGFISVNAFQHGRNQGLYQHPSQLRPANHDAKELIGVALGIAGHELVYKAPQDNFSQDELRGKLDRIIERQYTEGKASAWQINCVKHVNTELYHQGVNLRPEELVAITDAHEDMHACADDFTENPENWCKEKLRTESRIAQEFLAGGSKIGYLAHMSKGLFEASVCVAAQPVVVIKKVVTEGATDVAASIQTAQENVTQGFKAQLASMRATTKPPITPSVSPESGEEPNSPKFK